MSTAQQTEALRSSFTLSYLTVLSMSAADGVPQTAAVSARAGRGSAAEQLQTVRGSLNGFCAERDKQQCEHRGGRKKDIAHRRAYAF